MGCVVYFKSCSIKCVINVYVNFHLLPSPGTGVSLKSLIRQPHTTSLQPLLHPISTRRFPESLRDGGKYFFSSLKGTVCGLPTNTTQAHLPSLKQSASLSLLEKCNSFLTQLLKPAPLSSLQGDHAAPIQSSPCKMIF